MLANFASNPKNSKGRLYPETDQLNLLSPFSLDRYRIIESTAFRRLEHKTQVFISNEGDHYRNRLTHSLEAAQIARIVSDALGICADLSETLTLAHDLGHAAFGHAGEEALNEVVAEYGLKFDHNSHTIKLLTQLEKYHPQFDGLNLSWEVIEGIAKHNGPLLNLDTNNIVALYSQKHDLDLTRHSSLESQVSALSDDIAYNNHDIDDGVRAGLIHVEELREISLLGGFVSQVSQEYPQLKAHKLVMESVQRMKNMMILDLIENSKKNLKEHNIESCEDVRLSGIALVGFSEKIEAYHQEIKKFLMINVYKSASVNRMTSKGRRVIKELFYIYMNEPGCLPGSWQEKARNLSERERAVIVCDFIACMSDRYAMLEYRSFFDLSL